jgi:hypothetical protein
MGFTKWMFKNGPGSIGSTAKTWTKIYLDHISGVVGNKEEIRTAGFYHVVILYEISYKRYQQYNSTPHDQLVNRCGGSLALLMWLLICEIPANINALKANKKNSEIAVEVIYECVKELAPQEVLINFATFREDALEYLTDKIFWSR